MDCPNCGAYNASSSIRCRRCDQILPAARDDRSSDDDTREREDRSFDTAWDAPPPEEPAPHRSEDEDDAQDQALPEWGYSSEQELQQDPWPASQTEEPAAHGTSGSFGDPSRPTPGSGPGYGPPPDIPNYLWQSIAVTLCCCWPAGIPAIVFAARVNSLKEAGDYTKAQAESDRAKLWTIIALVLGLIAYIAFICIALASEA